MLDKAILLSDIKNVCQLTEFHLKQLHCFVIMCTDVQANEKLIEQLKKAMEEQEQVMVMQDTHTKKKEEECEQLLKGGCAVQG